ncbi:hypothetical protein EMIHUDRAFT_240024 [Emiliania huxleyi CCMP1516]|uniref:Uncharacterized protein n=2 Tax=Emiliania huxleyi TaxID=2903 RepID=A0A0D3JGI4_EMIH1|nr:hypothetical protein EMIHUDRAFT_240024 [Emiliania huxleyi CCMP1516]EOD22619.1 hypothetical protein EMIHUDRAFT_240024 [Emiliania huxleyi CCMP1516]|eukprot:XP_005775048.1 hypothetical protein EMIHUDRAFT_240024 [Emiliania huxleyi CCMP1516]
MSARVTLADFRALQENLLALKHENYAMRELLRRQQAQAAAPEGAASPAWYPPDLNPFGPGLPRPSTPPATGDGGSAAGSEPEQGSTGGGDTPLPATPERAVSPRAFALRDAATLRLAWHGWRAAHTQSRMLKNLGPLLASQQPAVASLCTELEAAEEREHALSLRCAREVALHWRATDAGKRALWGLRRRGSARLHFGAWRERKPAKFPFDFCGLIG